MTADDVLATLPIADWQGLFEPVSQRHAVDAMKSGRVPGYARAAPARPHQLPSG
jgi:hypothetical protein